MRRSVAFGLQVSVGTSDAHFVISAMNQYVALLVNRNSTGCEEGCFLCGVTGRDAMVAFAAYRPLLMLPRDDVLVFAHSTSPMSEKRCLNYIDNLCLKKYDTFCRG